MELPMEQQTTNIDLTESDQPKENGDTAACPGIVQVSDERRDEITKEMMELECQICDLREAILRKEKQLTDLRAELGITRWTRIQNSEAVNKSKQAIVEASAKTSQVLRDFGSATANKWTEIRESPRMQTVSEKFWSTTDAVKAKIVGERKTIAHEPPAAQIVVSPETHHHH